MFRKSDKTTQKREIAVIIIAIPTSFLFFGILWVMSVWADLDVNEILFHLKTPLSGAGNGMIAQYITHGIIPVSLTVLFILAAIFLLRDKAGYKTLLSVFAFVLLSTALLTVSVFWQRVGIGTYIVEQIQDSPFIEDNYVDASSVDITFPEQKRNLIYIYLESMEMSFADKQSGGGFDFNCIPELTELALKNECFAGNSGKLNGGYVMPGTNFTMGGLFGQTSGLPMKLGISDTLLDEHGGWDGMDTQSSFFSGVTVLGDILKAQGYEQEILFGSDAVFGGRKLYYSQHGDYLIRDYNYAVENGWIPENYYVFWGFEDEKLLDFAKSELTRLAAEGKPFNLSFLTVDTHFEDGYVCRLCENEFGDNQYANVMACSSRQIYNFVKWVQAQDFYENTTIIINGDHTTMDSDFCDDMDETYGRRTYTAVINPYEAPLQADKERIYTTLDNFPTTLGALGVKIEGGRLGLGTDLFSSEPTLAETYGIEKMSAELAKRSKFMTELSNIDTSAEKYYRSNSPEADLSLKEINEEANTISLYARDFDNLDEGLASASAVITDLSDKTLVHTTDLKVNGSGPDTELEGQIDTSGINLENAQISIMAVGRSGIEYSDIAIASGNLYMDNLDYYLDFLKASLQTGKYSILLSAKGDISMSMTDEAMEKFHALGIRTDLQHIQSESYYAVITPEAVTEENGEKELTHDGTLPDSSPYSILSAGETVGTSDTASSIIINGGDYSINRRGMNIVLYDHVSGQVEDAVCFNTNFGLNASRTLKRKFVDVK